MSSEKHIPLSYTLLRLLENLANVPVAYRRVDGTLRLESIALDPEGITLTMSLRGLPPALTGPFPLRLRIAQSSPQCTRADLVLPTAPGLQRVLGIGLKAVPQRLLNDALGSFFQGVLTMEGEQVVIGHAALLESLGRGNRQ